MEWEWKGVSLAGGRPVNIEADKSRQRLEPAPVSAK